MKKFFYLILIAAVYFCPKQTYAEESNNLRNMLISDDIIVEEKAGEAKNEAGRLLDTAPKKLEIKGLNVEPLKRRRSTVTTTTTTTTSVSNSDNNDNIISSMEVFDKYGEAPFGLAWGSSVNYTKSTGVILEDVSTNENPRTFLASYLPKPVNDFKKVVLFFGKDNKLWRIIGYGTEFDDNAKGSKVLREYNKYIRLLENKYSNKKETFIPKTTTVEKIKNLPGNRTEVSFEEIKSTIGDETFVEDLKNEETYLYSTFNAQDLGVALGINVTEDDKTNIIIDYTNFKLVKEQEDAMINAL